MDANSCRRISRPKPVSDAVIAAAMERLGGIDILVNNAGVQIEKSVEEMTDAEFDQLMSVNTGAVFRMSRATIPTMRQAGGGVILNIGSISANNADPQMAVYNASKGFVHSLTRSIAVDHGKDGIRCNSVSPGWIMTEMADAAFDLANGSGRRRTRRRCPHASGPDGKA